MPYWMRKVRYQDCYAVKSKTRTFAKCAEKDRAKSQLKLLRALKWNNRFTPSRNRTMKKAPKKKTQKLRRSERLKNKSKSKGKKRKSRRLSRG